MTAISDIISQLQNQKHSLQGQIEKIDEALTTLSSLHGGGEIPIPKRRGPKPKGKGRGMSAAGREAVRQAQIKRWAKLKKSAAPASADAAPRAKRGRKPKAKTA